MRTSHLPIQTGSPASTWMVPKPPKTEGKSLIWPQPTSYGCFATTFPFPGSAELYGKVRRLCGWLTFEAMVRRARCDFSRTQITQHRNRTHIAASCLGLKLARTVCGVAEGGSPDAGAFLRVACGGRV